ncbi:hypothetical protein [Cylindrospermum sp. FACHB-282]|uniref:hypothetical protein n=1 Tax=Cylindrospermum sp. FACHB-282 TaxID=2692794 RepID=UPI0016867A3C|nr:hypothetical protein [Cylindrospermum sp. FACHB-282]MBD2385803.1 hypothetical protein [Cylindrospermum sp. FACHB-282]
MNEQDTAIDKLKKCDPISLQPVDFYGSFTVKDACEVWQEVPQGEEVWVKMEVTLKEGNNSVQDAVIVVKQVFYQSQGRYFAPSLNGWLGWVYPNVWVRAIILFTDGRDPSEIKKTFP